MFLKTKTLSYQYNWKVKCCNYFKTISTPKFVWKISYPVLCSRSSHDFSSNPNPHGAFHSIRSSSTKRKSANLRDSESQNWSTRGAVNTYIASSWSIVAGFLKIPCSVSSSLKNILLLLFEVEIFKWATACVYSVNKKLISGMKMFYRSLSDWCTN